MTILLTGGGTGGHITPTLAVAHELKKQRPDIKLVYILERNSRFVSLLEDDSIDVIKQIYAGKWRRYHGQTRKDALVDIKTNLLNLRDLCFSFVGFLQSLAAIHKYKPSVVFVKGGYVGLPVGAAAALRHLPIITHDSDSLPGLTNRIVARWAKITATAYPANNYAYPVDKIRVVGVPVSANFHTVTKDEQASLLKKLGIPSSHRLIFITGGSLGAVRLNRAVVAIIPKLLSSYPDLHVVHQIGGHSNGVYGAYKNDRLQVYEFLPTIADYSGAADVIVGRPGATTVAEMGVQAKPLIIIPNPLLAEGHQLKNAEILATHEAALIVPENDNLTETLEQAIRLLLDRPEQGRQLASRLHALFKPDAAQTLAMLLLDQTKS